MLEQILIAALFSFGWCTLFTVGNLFESVGDWAEKKLPIIWKPLGGCVVCNAFWVATLMYWLFWGNIWHEWLTISIAASGTNSIISAFIPVHDD